LKIEAILHAISEGRSEARIKCKIRIRKFSKPARSVVLNFGLFSFGFVSGFDIRISDLAAAYRSEKTWSIAVFASGHGLFSAN